MSRVEVTDETFEEEAGRDLATYLSLRSPVRREARSPVAQLETQPMTQPHLILIKHAMPRIVEGAPSKDWLLSAEGRAAAARLAERLADFAPDTVVASPEPKAHETGAIIASRLGLPLGTDDGLIETRRETVGWMTREAIEAGIRRFFEEPADLVFGEETADDAYARFAAAVACHQPRPGGGGPTVVVCHGTVISLYVSRRTGAEAFGLWKSLTLPHALVLGVDGQVLDSIEA